MNNIIIDDEFKKLIPPLTADERAGLEESIKSEGCRDAIVIWNNTIIDGHNRYDICTQNNIAFNTISRDFESREKVIEWIILNQFSRRNISAFVRSELALKLKEMFAEKAKENKVESGRLYGENHSKELLQNSAKPLENIDTREKISQIANVSHDTIAKVEAIKKKAPEPVITAARNNDISINMAHEVTKMQKPEIKEISERIEQGEKPKEVIKEVKLRPHVANNSGNNEWYTPENIIKKARECMGSIDTDPASNYIAQKIVKANIYYTIENSGLEKEWNGNVWLNPPYSAELIGKFIDKLKSERKNFSQAIILVNNATETQWFNEIIKIASMVCFPRSRVKFYMPDGQTGAPLQGQAILYIGDNKSKFSDIFEELGWIAEVKS